MLGKELSICELLPHWHLSYRELPDDPNDSRRWLDRLAPDGTWNANLFEFYMRAIRKLHEGLKVPFALEAGQFRIDDTPVHQAVREALVNTLVHADYQGRSGVRLIRARSSFEFVNPGLLLVSPEQVWRGGVSESRNPALQKRFGFLQLGEREGSGGPKVRHVWQQQHWRLPHLGQDTENSETHLLLRQESLLPEPIVDALLSRLHDGFTNQDELGRSILVTAEAEGSITHARARELTDRHSRDVTLKLQELLRRGYLESDGKTRGTTYRPVLSADIGHNIGHNIGHSDRPRGREDPEELRRAILAFCGDEWKTLGEIALTLGRSEQSVRKRYLPPLLEQDVLERRYPDQPRHTLQAYRTTRKDP